MLALNNFFAIHYPQKLGCAIGTKCAPNYANIFMRKFELTLYIHIFKHFQIFIVDLSIIYFYYGMKTKHDY